MAFGKKITIAIGLLVAIVASLLEGVSLLRIDIFSGILFAAPTAAFIMGMLWKKVTPASAIVSMIAGLGGGLIAYFTISDPDQAQFIGNLISLVLPYIVLLVWGLFTKYEYDFTKLKDYRPSQKVHVAEEV
jgi:Na+/proline symporter